MKRLVLVFALILASEASWAKSFWTALAEIESGGNDYAVGDVGEISRYQIRPEVWRMYSSSTRFTDASVALPIAKKYMAKLERDFLRATGREATEADRVILWKSGIAGYEKRGFNPARMSAAHKDRVVRFNNLRTEGMLLVAAPVVKPVATNSLPAESKPMEAKVMETVFFKPVRTPQTALSLYGDYDGETSTNTVGGVFTRQTD